MSSPIYIPLNYNLLKDLIEQIDAITDSSNTYDEILEYVIDFINTYSYIYDLQYNGNDKYIKSILTELNDIKKIINSDTSIEFKVETIRMLSIYRIY